ncbi:unnamed protein product, partial [Brachionus calyciflorus]
CDIKFDDQIIYWKCERTCNKTTPKCYGRSQTQLFNFPIKVTVDHNHEPDPIKEEVYVYTTKILARACLTNEDPRTIIKECLVGISSLASCKMPRVPALTQRIQRLRLKKSDHGKNPENLESIDIPDSLKYTHRNELFFYDDSGSDDKNR